MAVEMNNNIAYQRFSENAQAGIESEPRYETVLVQPSRNQPQENSSSAKSPTFRSFTCVTMAVALPLLALIITLAVTIFLAVTSTAGMSELNQEIRILNDSNEIIRSELALIKNVSQCHVLNQEIRILNDSNEIIRSELALIRNVIRGKFYNTPLSSCKDLPQTDLVDLSGQYWIQASDGSSPAMVYCDTTQRRCSCNTSATEGWMRVANIDMIDPNQTCPDGFRLVNRTESPLRTCGRPGPAGCVSIIFPTHGIEYSRVCGLMIGYQDKTPDAFKPYVDKEITSIDSYYVNGVSLTHGQSPRQHIWTFAAGVDEITHSSGASIAQCPCTVVRPGFTDSEAVTAVPPFVGQDYFCATGARGHNEFIFYADDPLWDGQGCGGTSTCCEFNNPPWFCKQLPQPTTDDIELRICGDQHIDDEDTPIEKVQIFVN